MTFEQAFIDELEKIADEDRGRTFQEAYLNQKASKRLAILGSLLGAIPGSYLVARRINTGAVGDAIGKTLGELAEEASRRTQTLKSLRAAVGAVKGPLAAAALGGAAGGLGGYILGRYTTKDVNEPMRWGRTLAAAPLNAIPFAGPILSASLYKGKIPKKEKK